MKRFVISIVMSAFVLGCASWSGKKADSCCQGKGKTEECDVKKGGCDDCKKEAAKEDNGSK